MTYIQSVHKHARMWMRACGSSHNGWVVSSLCAWKNPSSGQPCHTHVGCSHTFSLPAHHSTQHYLDRATFSKTTLYTDNHFRKNLFSLFQNNFLTSPYQQTQSGRKTTRKNHSQIPNMRVPETCASTLPHLKARKGFKLKEREDDPMDVDFVHKESQKGKGKGNDKGKGKSKGKGKPNTMRKERVLGKASGFKKRSEECAETVQMERMLGERRRSCETRGQCRWDGENWWRELDHDGSCFPHNTRNIVGTSENVFERLLAREGRTSTLFNISKNLVSSSHELRLDTAGNTMESEMRREPQNSSIPVPTLAKWRWNVKSYWWNLFSQWYYWLSEISDFGIASGKISWLYGISKLESQLYDWSMFKDSRSSSHNALDQRSRDGKVNGRAYDIALDYRAKRFHRLSICLMRWLCLHWKDFSTCIFTSAKEKVSKSSVLKKKKDRFLRGRQIAYMVYEHFRATGATEAVQGLSDLFNKRLQNDDVQDFDTISSISSKWNTYRNGPGGFIQVKIAGFCSASDCFGSVWTREYWKQRTTETFQIEDISKTSYWSDHEDEKLQSPERNSGGRISHQESKRKESPRWEESGRVFSVEGTWTMFKRRLMKFQSWQTSTWRLVRWSETKRTIVFFRTKFEGQDWRRSRKILKNIRQLKGKLFRQKERNSVPLQNM